MILRGASALYGAAARRRREWYARDPARRRRLERPVISVGNLSAGGRGKTPVVRAIAKFLYESGERPGILSRGYARKKRPQGVTVVSDPSRVLAGVELAGDEPLMLARALPGVPVVVSADRHSAGVLAESRFAVTVHLLDDGFQHVALRRDIDLVLLDDADLDDCLLPAGRLREPLDALRLADAILAPVESSAVIARAPTSAPGVPLFNVRRILGTPVPVHGGADWDGRRQPAYAVAAVARPERFFADLLENGWRLTGKAAYRDHHWFTAADISEIVHAARRTGAAVIVTTEKDAVRLEQFTFEMPVVRVPLSVTIEPDNFFVWLQQRLAQSRSPKPGSPQPEAREPEA